MKKKSVSGKTIQYGPLAAWTLLCEFTGIIGSVFTVQAIPTWYASLVKPSFSPPNWIFGPVWTLLYALMGIAAYRIWQIGWGKRMVRYAVYMFLVHLVVNGLWSFIFFGMKNIGLALADIVVMWGLIIYLIVLFKRLDKISAYLLVPYLAWVSFATVLNWSILLIQ